MTSRIAALFEHDRLAAEERVRSALRRSGGRRDRAAEKLGISYRTLHRLLKANGLETLPSRVRAGVR